MNFILIMLYSDNYTYYKKYLQYFSPDYKPEPLDFWTIFWTSIISFLFLIIIYCIFHLYDDDC